MHFWEKKEFPFMFWSCDVHVGRKGGGEIMDEVMRDSC